MYKSVALLYIVCISCYILFTRSPDYFEGDFIKGVVTQAGFDSTHNQPSLNIQYHVGTETYTLTTTQWFLKSYKQGEQVSIIYDPNKPGNASIYAFIGYWLRWNELFVTLGLFIVFFMAAVFITGKHSEQEDDEDEDKPRKMKYDL